MIHSIEQLAFVWAAALDSQYMPLLELVSWADDQIKQLDTPPVWLIDVAFSQSTDDAVSILLRQRYNRRERPYIDYTDLYLGFLYLRYERGDLGLEQLLKAAGDRADISNYRIDCSTFYYMLNEIDGRGPTSMSNRPLTERVAETFAPIVEIARRHERSLRGHI